MANAKDVLEAAPAEEAAPAGEDITTRVDAREKQEDAFCST